MHLFFTRNKKQPKKGFLYHFLSTAVTISKYGFLAFFEAKMAKIDIQTLKLNVPDDYIQFWVHFEWFLELFQISDEKWLFS